MTGAPAAKPSRKKANGASERLFDPDGMEHTYRMLDLMIDGLRFGTPR